MKIFSLLLLLFSVPALAQDQSKPTSPCLIVKRRTETNRIGSVVLLGPLALAVNWYTTVESSDVPKVKKTYGASDLKKLEKSGVHVEILPGDYTNADLDRAHDACQKGSAVPVTSLIPLREAVRSL